MGEALPERAVDAVLAGHRDLASGLHDQVVTPEGADHLAGVPLDRQPVGLLDLELLGVGQSHEHVVVDELMIAQRLPGGVEALEDLLGVGRGAECDRHVLQPLEPAPDEGGLFGLDLASEEGVVVVEARFTVVVATAVEHDRLKQMCPGVMGAELGTGCVLLPDQDPLQLCGQRRVRLPDRVMQRGDEQHQRRDPLLAVDEHEIGAGLDGVLRGEDRTDEVAVTVVLRRDRTHVGQQLLAAADVPAILSLIHRDDDHGPRGGEPLDRVDGGRLDVCGRAHAAQSPPNRSILRRRAGAAAPERRS
ncbi:hypothetical protein ABE10_26235 [Bacillus toyonensis]|nr:hypothetical protein [Bacillus toyonensis]